ncbi:class I SAM-dependent methyltransferase [Acidiphilium acidophilum]|uniref:Class I SAM-dependent methyltransferase n=1 Tax=Acidiphilium acidophilum TaxID=76588 RepID=A0AAW9DT75_ACIAO|nr:class I SAM-dependent methyltransferase [Acidiphilium acidophilum]MDX5931242.1 class I SAM-dependent methyltransferase [Acidiphilium acidophilum]
MSKVGHRFGRDAFGDDPARYDAARPAYPDELYERLEAIGALRRGISIFEIGPGTGLATRRLLDYRPRRLLAVEPDSRLAAYLADRFRLHEGCDALGIATAPFETVGLAPESFDLGIAATSFHWVRQPGGLDRVRAALLPGGWWAMWWTNFGTAISDDFQIAIQPIFMETLGVAAQGSRTRLAFDLDHSRRRDQLGRAGFAQIGVMSWQRRLRLTTAALIDLYSSFSVIKALPDGNRSRLLDGLADIAETRFGGAPERVFTTTLYTAQNPLRAG